MVQAINGCGTTQVGSRYRPRWLSATDLFQLCPLESDDHLVGLAQTARAVTTLDASQLVVRNGHATRDSCAGAGGVRAPATPASAWTTRCAGTCACYAPSRREFRTHVRDHEGLVCRRGRARFSPQPERNSANDWSHRTADGLGAVGKSARFLTVPVNEIATIIHCQFIGIRRTTTRRQRGWCYRVRYSVLRSLRSRGMPG